MKIAKYKLVTQDLDQVVNYLADHLSFDYENHSTNMSVMAQEEYHLRSTSSQLNMVVVKKQEESVLLDIMGGAGGAGMFNHDFGSENGYLRKACIVLERYSMEFGIDLEELEQVD